MKSTWNATQGNKWVGRSTVGSPKNRFEHSLQRKLHARKTRPNPSLRKSKEFNEKSIIKINRDADRPVDRELTRFNSAIAKIVISVIVYAAKTRSNHSVSREALTTGI